MTKAEIELVNRLVVKDGWEVANIERRSDREFDLKIEGKYGPDHPYMPGVSFSAWLVLASIRELTNWTSREVAEITNHPNMVIAGDWSGVRDSDNERIWNIFDRFVKN
jgi:hypothetical protein